MHILKNCVIVIITMGMHFFTLRMKVDIDESYFGRTFSKENE